MIILKVQEFADFANVAKFVNLNNIKRENILSITSVGSPSAGSVIAHFIYYYADSDAQEMTHGVFGWSK